MVFNKKCPFHNKNGNFYEAVSFLQKITHFHTLGLTLSHALDRIAQPVTCLTDDTCLTADPGVASLILARSHTFTEIDHEIKSMAILLPSANSRRVVVSYKRKYLHKVLVNCLVKLTQEKSVVR